MGLVLVPVFRAVEKCKDNCADSTVLSSDLGCLLVSVAIL
jgi:hypothetical protein